MPENVQIQMEESPRSFFTQIPNILFKLVKAKWITGPALQFYAFLRQVAGEFGKCFMGSRKIAEETGLSRATVTRLKKELSAPIPVLNGKSLIKIKPGDKTKEQADIITITDIWVENDYFFKNKITWPIREPGVAHLKARGGPSEGHNKNPINKNSSKKIVIADPEPEPEKKIPEKTVPAGGNNKFFKCLEKCEDLSDRQKVILSKNPEPIVEQAVKYCYHPNTKIEGGPIGRMKMLQHIIKNPEDYAETLANLDKPKEVTFKEKILSSFERGKIYNHYIFDYDEKCYTFTVPTTGFQYRFEWRDREIKEKMKMFVAKFKR